MGEMDHRDAEQAIQAETEDALAEPKPRWQPGDPINFAVGDMVRVTSAYPLASPYGADDEVVEEDRRLVGCVGTITQIEAEVPWPVRMEGVVRPGALSHYLLSPDELELLS